MTHRITTSDPKFFLREDESDDSVFYAFPRFVTHIDDATIAAITEFYREILKPDDRILDLMSSWISHLPEEMNFQQVEGLGMNRLEMEHNPRLDKFVVQNLNNNPELPWSDDSFDKVLIAVSIQYVTRPYEVFREIGRILKKNGQCIVLLSHRIFPTKAVRGFMLLPPHERCHLVGDYMETGANLKEVEIIDRSPANADPLWIVKGSKP